MFRVRVKKSSENTTTPEKWFPKKRYITKKGFKYIFSIIALLMVGLLYFGIRCLPRDDPATPLRGSSIIYASHVIDGDTIKLSNGERVRLIGIDTPESRYNDKLARDVKRSNKDINAIIGMGKEASKFTKKLAEGKQVSLEFDVVKRDKYGRMLAYVYLEDGTFVNAKIVEEGYAQALTIPPNVKYADLFLRLQEAARKNGRGLYKDDPDKSLF